MEINVQNDGGVTTITLSGRLDTNGTSRSVRYDGFSAIFKII
jgi:hypothetical protein